MAERDALIDLAEEAEELKRVLEDLKFDRRVAVCDKLQRIVAELTKVKFYDMIDGTIMASFSESADALVKCRAIAEGA